MSKTYNVKLDKADIGLLTDILIAAGEKSTSVCCAEYYLELINKIQEEL